MLQNVIDAIFNRLGRQIIVQPLGMLAVVLYTHFLPKRLAHQHTTMPIDVDGDRIGHVWLGCEQLDRQFFRILERSNRLLPLVAGTCNIRGLRRRRLGDGGTRLENDKSGKNHRANTKGGQVNRVKSHKSENR